jgi:hypothetical protein
MVVQQQWGYTFIMERRQDDLAFTVSEASSLTAIFAIYIPEYSVQADTDRLRGVWSMASEISIGSLTRKLSRSTVREYLEQKLEEDLPPPRNLPVSKLVTILHADEFVVEDGARALGPVIKWASDHFVLGSIIMQNTIGSKLNSDYEDNPMTQALGRSNQDYADYTARNMVLVGMQAGEWLEEIRRET